MNTHAIDDRIAYELFALDRLEGRQTCSSVLFSRLRDDEKAIYLADARAARRRLDALAMAAALHRAYQAAEKTLEHTGLTEAGRSRLKLAVKAALEAHHAHLATGNPDVELREFEQAQGIPAPRPLTLVSVRAVPSSTERCQTCGTRLPIEGPCDQDHGEVYDRDEE